MAALRTGLPVKDQNSCTWKTGNQIHSNRSRLYDLLLNLLIAPLDPGLVDDVDAFLRTSNGHPAAQSFDVCLIIRRRSLIETH